MRGREKKLLFDFRVEILFLVIKVRFHRHVRHHCGKKISVTDRLEERKNCSKH